MSVREEITGAYLVMPRRLTWAETNAAGHNHFSAGVRWLEEAEHELFHRLGLVRTVPLLPRVHVELDFRDRIYFGDELTVIAGIISVGRSSATFGTEVIVGDATKLEARHTVVHCPEPNGGSGPWPAEVKELLAHYGAVPPREPVLSAVAIGHA